MRGQLVQLDRIDKSLHFLSTQTTMKEAVNCGTRNPLTLGCLLFPHPSQISSHSSACTYQIDVKLSEQCE